MQSQVQVMYRCGVGLGPLKAVQDRESTRGIPPFIRNIVTYEVIGHPRV
jgi:hypothetical protein